MTRVIASATALERGRAADPAERFASMGDLLCALTRDPAKAWRRVAAAAVPILAEATTIAISSRADALAVEAGKRGPSYDVYILHGEVIVHRHSGARPVGGLRHANDFGRNPVTRG